jgi:ankyrin repeat protein
MQLLLQAGADVHPADGDGITCLHYAVGLGDTAVLVAQMLLEHGASVNCTGHEGLTPLHMAAALGNVEAVGFLLGHGASINRETEAGYTALIAALSENQSAVAQLLLDKGAAVDAEILQWAAEQSDVDQGVLLVVTAPGPAADAGAFSNLCRSAAAASAGG